MYEQLKDSNLYKKSSATKWKCADCGYEETLREAWCECPLCQAKQGATLLKIAD
jgi:rubrerythrin